MNEGRKEGRKREEGSEIIKISKKRLRLQRKLSEIPNIGLH